MKRNFTYKGKFHLSSSPLSSNFGNFLTGGCSYFRSDHLGDLSGSSSSTPPPHMPANSWGTSEVPGGCWSIHKALHNLHMSSGELTVRTQEITAGFQHPRLWRQEPKEFCGEPARVMTELDPLTSECLYSICSY